VQRPFFCKFPAPDPDQFRGAGTAEKIMSTIMIMSRKEMPVIPSRADGEGPHSRLEITQS
jgi:hypothetical protein